MAAYEGIMLILLIVNGAGHYNLGAMTGLYVADAGRDQWIDAFSVLYDLRRRLVHGASSKDSTVTNIDFIRLNRTELRWSWNVKLSMVCVCCLGKRGALSMRGSCASELFLTRSFFRIAAKETILSERVVHDWCKSACSAICFACSKEPGILKSGCSIIHLGHLNSYIVEFLHSI